MIKKIKSALISVSDKSNLESILKILIGKDVLQSRFNEVKKSFVLLINFIA